MWHHVCVVPLLFGDSHQHRCSTSSLLPAVAEGTAVLGCHGSSGLAATPATGCLLDSGVKLSKGVLRLILSG